MFRLARQEQFAIGGLVLLLAAVIVGLTVHRRPAGRGVPVEDGLNTGASGAVQDTEDAANAAAAVTVHVTGAVESPGVYRLPLGARVNDDKGQHGTETDAQEAQEINTEQRRSLSQQRIKKLSMSQ